MRENIRLIKLSENYVRPAIVEVKSKGYVKNGKKPTEFYDYIIKRYKGSPTNSAILNTYSDMIMGNGLKPFNNNYNVEEWVKLRKVLKSKDLKAIVSDFVVFSEACFQVTENKGGDLFSITHVPKNKVLPSIEDENENINSYWYSKNWDNINKYPPEEIEAFSYDKNQKKSIYNIKPYSIGNSYFSDPEYLSGMTYAELEEEISNFYINHVKNGLSFGYIINIPSGNVMTEDEKNDIEREIKSKLTGSSNAGKFVLNFTHVSSNGTTAEITVTPLEVNDAHNQWEYLTKESRQQLLTAHRVTSPMLFGIKDNTGLGNNADELRQAKELLIENTIKPKRQPIIDAIEDVLLKYGIGLSLSFSDLENKEESVNLSSEQKINLEDLGEYIDENSYDLIDDIEVDYEEEDRLFKNINLASTGTARPNSKSSQDGDNYIVRYKYTGNKNPQREFCKKMMKANKVYRKEDILQMGELPVNKGWGPNGADTYSIWLYKGGGNCHHKWVRQIYLKKGSSVDVNSPLAEIISTSKARREGIRPETNNSLVSIEPRNMDNKGFLKK